ncbi:peptidase C14 caspase catalytic subunit p20, partial [Candidatus Thiomargarita nelsonii]
CVLLSRYNYKNLGLYRQTGSYRLQEIDGRTLSKDEILSFSLHNQSQKDYYCYLINIAYDGAIYAMFPNPKDRVESARLKKGEMRQLLKEVVLPLTELGEETIKVITSNHPIDASLFEQAPFDRDALNPLEQLVVNAVHGSRRQTSIKYDEWATEQISFRVK